MKVNLLMIWINQYWCILNDLCNVKFVYFMINIYLFLLICIFSSFSVLSYTKGYLVSIYWGKPIPLFCSWFIAEFYLTARALPNTDQVRRCLTSMFLWETVFLSVCNTKIFHHIPTRGSYLPCIKNSDGK